MLTIARNPGHRPGNPLTSSVEMVGRRCTADVPARIRSGANRDHHVPISHPAIRPCLPAVPQHIYGKEGSSEESSSDSATISLQRVRAPIYERSGQTSNVPAQGHFGCGLDIQPGPFSHADAADSAPEVAS